MQSEVVKIPLTHGLFALVDAEDAEKVQGYKWMAYTRKRNGVIYAYGYHPSNTRKNITMHRLIVDAPDGVDVDHANHDGLDNRRENLRCCTRTENCRNRRAFNLRSGQPKASQHVGVSRHPNTNKWRAYININGRQIHLGFFCTEEEAARVRDAAVKQHYGEFAILNFEEASNAAA